MSLKGVLGAAQARKTTGQKITRMGQERRGKVRDLVANALQTSQSVGELARELRRQADAPVRHDKRNWVNVAQTELTDANARAALDLIHDIHGPDQQVYRLTRNCCDACAKAFGHHRHPRTMAAGKVPDHLAGAVHPQCKCGPWIPVGKPDLFRADPWYRDDLEGLAGTNRRLQKAIRDPGETNQEFSETIRAYCETIRKAGPRERSGWPQGTIRRVPNGIDHDVEISAKNIWVPLASVTGRAIQRHCLSHLPFVTIGEREGFTIARHGFGRPAGRFWFLDPAKTHGAIFYERDPFDAYAGSVRETRMARGRTWDQYFEHLMRVLPTVINQPEYWSNPHELKHLPDFLGYKTLTDWFVVLPAGFPPGSRMKRGVAGVTGVRATARELMRGTMGRDEIRKQGPLNR